MPQNKPSVETNAIDIKDSDFIAMTFNVQNIFDGIDNHQEYSDYKPPQWTEKDYQKRLVSIGKAIQSLDFIPSLIAFQEVEHKGIVEDIQQYYLPSLTYMAYTDNKYSATENVLLSKYEIVNVNTHTIDSHIEKGTRHILEVRVNMNEVEVQVLVVHLKSKRVSKGTPSDTIRQFQYNVIDRIIDDTSPTMILGDFNDDTPLPHLKNNTLLELNLESHTGIQGTYNYQDNWNRLDHILFDDDFDDMLANEHLLVFDISPFINSYGYPNKFIKRRKNFSAVSDHLPLVFYADFME